LSARGSCLALPYVLAQMAMDRARERVRYDSKRRIGPPAELHVEWTVGDALGAAAAGSIDHFLVERYALYAARAGLIKRARVRHRPYPLHRAAVAHLSETLSSAAGIPPPAEAPLLHYSPGVDVDIFPPRRVRRHRR